MITLVLAPLTQLNTPYPSIAYLSRTLRREGIPHSLRDLGLELALKLFSRQGLAQVFDSLDGREDLPEPAWRALSLRRQHEAAIEPVIRFLQGRDRTLAPRILDTPFLPKGPRLERAVLDRFGPMSSDDAARHLATLYLEDLADLVTSCVDEGFGLARYQHHLGVGPCAYDPLHKRLKKTTLIDAMLDELADSIQTDLVGISVPFPGTLYGALRIGKRIKARGGQVILGGGYVNTELRNVKEPRLWECIDQLCYDDGEGPLLAILEQRGGGADKRHRTRTSAGMIDQPHDDVPTESAAWYQDLPLDRYLQLVDGVNPAHRLWGDGRWNKITLAHGCYWKKCSFCDIQLDYIRRYAPSRASQLVDQMEELVAATGQSGFHLADEAAPPKGMWELAEEILRRGLSVSWWGNIRFDSAFTPDLCKLLAASGLVAVTGGLEVASDRLLTKMEKGVTVEGVARAARAFRDAGVMVHAYLMYGFPTQTEQETVDAMEVVRQLFEAEVLSSAFWHRFVLTRHSGMYPRLADFGITAIENKNSFAQNDVEHRDPTGANADHFDEVLPRALAAWMRGESLDLPVHSWKAGLPKTTVAPDRIARALKQAPKPPEGRLLWLGGEVFGDDHGLVLHGMEQVAKLRMGEAQAAYLGELLMAVRPGGEKIQAKEVKLPLRLWEQLRELGMVVV
jgi:radical SAM superfamily enzyme YgiQ (UPF0313 family)